MANIREAIEGILAPRRKHNMPLLEGTPGLVSWEICCCLSELKAEGLPLKIETDEIKVASRGKRG